MRKNSDLLVSYSGSKDPKFWRGGQRKFYTSKSPETKFRPISTREWLTEITLTLFQWTSWAKIWEIFALGKWCCQSVQKDCGYKVWKWMMVFLRWQTTFGSGFRQIGRQRGVTKISHCNDWAAFVRGVWVHKVVSHTNFWFKSSSECFKTHGLSLLHTFENYFIGTMIIIIAHSTPGTGKFAPGLFSSFLPRKSTRFPFSQLSATAIVKIHCTDILQMEAIWQVRANVGLFPTAF